jgi:hypothetical protein
MQHRSRTTMYVLLTIGCVGIVVLLLLTNRSLHQYSPVTYHGTPLPSPTEHSLLSRRPPPVWVVADEHAILTSPATICTWLGCTDLVPLDEPRDLPTLDVSATTPVVIVVSAPSGAELNMVMRPWGTAPLDPATVRHRTPPCEVVDAVTACTVAPVDASNDQLVELFVNFGGSDATYLWRLRPRSEAH